MRLVEYANQLTQPKQGSLEYNASTAVICNHIQSSDFALMLYVVIALMHYILHTALLSVY